MSARIADGTIWSFQRTICPQAFLWLIALPVIPCAELPAGSAAAVASCGTALYNI